MLKRNAAKVMVLGAVGFVTGCEDPTLGALAGKISVDACTNEGVLDCTAGFGTVRANQSQTVTLYITNKGDKELTITGLDLAGGTDPAFSVGRLPDKPISVGEQDFVTVVFRPVVANNLSTTVTIKSDASNVPDGQDGIIVTLNGNGTDPGAPNLTLTPDHCDFGEAAVGSTTFCEVAVGNNGSSDLVINDFGFDPATDMAFQPAGPFAQGAQLPPGTASTMRLQFRPTEARAYTGSVFLYTNDADTPMVNIPLSGAGGAAPTAVAKILTVNNSPPSSPLEVHPLDNVIVTGSDSVAGTPQRNIVSYRWEIRAADGTAGRPAGSTVELTNPNSRETGFRFNSSNQFRNGVDLVGTYSACLAVTDDAGATSTNTACATFTTTPAENLHIQVTWTDPTSDIDLHLLRGAGPRFTAQDCYFANCKNTGYSINWGGGNANPKLDVDDTNGFGPENINIQTPAAGNYVVGVHWYGGGGSTIDISVKIFVQGALQGEFTRRMTRCNQYWDVARIIWSSTGTIEAIDTVATETRGSCF